MICLRPMKREDIDGIVAVENASFSQPWSRQSLLDELTNKLAYYLVAADGKRVAGYVGAWFISGEGHITNIAVDPAYRRRGIGRALLEGLQAECKRREGTLLTLEVRVSNTPALKLYRSFGFEPAGRRKEYYQDNHEDALIMTKFRL